VVREDIKGRPSPTETFRTAPPAPCACASTKAETTSWQICNKYNDQFPAVTIPKNKFKELIQKNREFQIGLKNLSVTVTYFHVFSPFLNLFTLSYTEDEANLYIGTTSVVIAEDSGYPTCVARSSS
jgi:hypothetical protein